MNTLENLALLRAAVAAKMQYWDAFGKLENALTNGEFSDAVNDEIEGQISLLAAGLCSPEDTHMVVEEHLNDTIHIVRTF